MNTIMTTAVPTARPSRRMNSTMQIVIGANIIVFEAVIGATISDAVVDRSRSDIVGPVVAGGPVVVGGSVVVGGPVVVG